MAITLADLFDRLGTERPTRGKVLLLEDVAELVGLDADRLREWARAEQLPRNTAAGDHELTLDDVRAALSHPDAGRTVEAELYAEVIELRRQVRELRARLERSAEIRERRTKERAALSARAAEQKERLKRMLGKD